MATQNDRAILNSIFNPFMPTGECIFDEDIPEEFRDEEELTSEVKEAKELELEGVKEAEKGDFAKAIHIFTKAIEKAPQRASGFNNRAQVHRLNGDVNSAIEDLNSAINLSQGKGKAGCQAYCQRAAIHRFRGNDQLAICDFKKAAELGSEFAKHQLVQMNPYAALCNKMLGEMIVKLQKGDVMPTEEK